MPVEDDAGLIGYTDFGWEGVVGEFDGRLKYRVPPGATPEVAQQILWREKKREDRIRRRGLKVARWTWAQAPAARVFLGILAEQGIRPERRNSWLAD